MIFWSLIVMRWMMEEKSRPPVVWNRRSGFFIRHAAVFIVENGFGAIDKKEEDGSCHDSYRIDYLRAHIEKISIKKAKSL